MVGALPYVMQHLPKDKGMGPCGDVLFCFVFLATLGVPVVA